MKRAMRVLCLGCVAAWAAIGTLSAAEPAVAKGKFPVVGKIERFDPRLDALIPKDAAMEQLADGYKWTEGPVWIADRKCLLFSDIPNNRIVEWSEGGGAKDFMKPAGYTGKKERSGEPGSNGLLLDAEGRLVACQHGDRRIVRVERDGKWTTLVDNYQGKRLNSPNDAAYKSNGDLYFTDPIYGLEKGADDPARELKFCGVYRVANDGRVTLLTDQLSRPNGIAFSPDERTLYVANSDPAKAVWMAYRVRRDGTLGRSRVFYDITSLVGKMPGLPDGMKIDRAGNVFATGPGGVNIFAPDGTLLGRLNTGVPTANCRFGDDGATLYITANTTLVRIRTTTKGAEYR